MTSHETVCILNASDQNARITITIFFADRGPAGPYSVVVPGKRTKHLRFNDLKDPEAIPRDTDYASLIESDIPDCCATYEVGLQAKRKRPAEYRCLRRNRNKQERDRHLGLTRARWS